MQISNNPMGGTKQPFPSLRDFYEATPLKASVASFRGGTKGMFDLMRLDKVALEIRVFLIDMNMHIFFIINMIYHITDRISWETALKQGIYSPESVFTEGFIHCSFFSQVKYTKENYFKGKSGFIVLCIDETRLKNELRTEKGSSPADTDLYPHLYGHLNTDAVSDVIELEKWKE